MFCFLRIKTILIISIFDWSIDFSEMIFDNIIFPNLVSVFASQTCELAEGFWNNFRIFPHFITISMED